jgi:CRISPR-associated protein Csm3
MSNRKLYGRIDLRGTLEIKTGLHIGTAEGVMHVGGIDKQVVRDPVTQEPYIPGSSLRGKLRSLLERRHLDERIGSTGSLTFNRNVGGGGARTNRRHECDDRTEALQCLVCRLFGSTSRGSEGSNHPARLLVRDAFLQPESSVRLKRLPTASFMTEWKFENALDRITSAANPRQLERIPRGALFDVEFTYAVETDEAPILREDLLRVFEALSLLEADALGAHGSRGYGRIAFSQVHLISRRFHEDEETPLPVAEIARPAGVVQEAVRLVLAP